MTDAQAGNFIVRQRGEQRAWASQRTELRGEQSEGQSFPEDEMQRGTVRGPERPRGLNTEGNSQRAWASQRMKRRGEQSEGLSFPEDETQRGTVRGPELPRGWNAEDHLKTSDLLIIKEEFISDWCNNFRWNWRGKPINKTADSPVWSRNRQGRLHSDLWEKGKAYMCKKKKKKITSLSQLSW